MEKGLTLLTERVCIEYIENDIKINEYEKSIIDLTEEECVEIIEKERWKDGIFCPWCESKDIVKNGWKKSTGVKLKRYKCKCCKRTFNVKTKTIFENSKIPLRKWFVAIALLGTNATQFLSEFLCIAYSSAWRLVKKIRSIISIEEEKRVIYGSIIKLEIDEMFVSSGQKGKKNLDRPSRRRGLKANRGRGTFKKDKPAIVTFVDRNTKETMFFVPEHLSEDYVMDEIGKHVKIEGEGKIIVYTDKYRTYPKLKKVGYIHKSIDHSIEYVNGDIHINNCENRHSLLRPFLMIRRGISKYNLQSYVNLFQFFFNARLKSHNYIEIVLQVIRAIINFLYFLQCLKNQQFLEFLT